MTLTSALLTILLAADATPTNPYLDATQRLYLNLEYEEAQRMLEQAFARPGNTLQDDVRAAILEGLIHAELGRTNVVGAFKRALALDPHSSLPVKVSPKIEEFFEQAKKELGLAKKRAADPPSQVSPAPVEGAAVLASPVRRGLLVGAAMVGNPAAPALGAEVHAGYQLAHVELSLRGRAGHSPGIGGLIAWCVDLGAFRVALGARADAYPGVASLGFGPAAGARLDLAEGLGAIAAASLELYSTGPAFRSSAVILGLGLDWRPP